METFLIVVNSSVGRKGFVGYRYLFIITALKSTGKKVVVLSRDKSLRCGDIHFRLFGSSLLFRGLNYLRIKKLIGFNPRRLEIFIFNLFTAVILYFYKAEKVFSHEYLTIGKKHKFVLDIAIAPEIILINREEDLSRFFSNESRMEAVAIQRAKMILCPSIYIKDEMKKLNRNAMYNPFGFEYDENNFARKKRPSNSKLRLLFVGNYNERKGADYLNEIFDKGLDNCNLTVVGRVHLAPKNDKILTVGVTDPKKYYRDLDLLILPSRFEGSAKVIYEALSYGMPVICSYFSGPPSGINGIKILSKLDSESIREEITRFTDSNYYNVLTSTMESIPKSMDWTSYGERTANLIKC